MNFRKAKFERAAVEIKSVLIPGIPHTNHSGSGYLGTFQLSSVISSN